MIKLKRLINEASGGDVVYGEESPFGRGIDLWISWSPGSGQTLPLKDFKSVWITNSTSPKAAGHEDKHRVNDLVNWALKHKAVLKNKVARLHKIPVYNTVHSSDGGARRMSVWGGDIKPSGAIYMVISKETDGSYVIDFFKGFNEARNWVTSKTSD